MTIWSKKNGHWKQVSGTSQADKSAIWGRISGSIRSQTDLIDILDTLQRDLNNVRAEYLDKFNLEEVQLIRSRTDFEREPLIRTVSPGDVDKDDGRHAVNYAAMKRDAVMLDGMQVIKGLKQIANSNGNKWRNSMIGLDDIMGLCATTVPPQAHYGEEGVTVFNKARVIGFYAYSGSTLAHTDAEVVGLYVSEHAFNGCKNITSIKITGDLARIAYRAFGNCTTLTRCDVKRLAYAWVGSFSGSGVDTFIIREPNEDGTLANMVGMAFDNTPIADGTGYIYVPDALVEQYKTATNWIVYASQIKPISELPAEVSA